MKEFKKPSPFYGPKKAMLTYVKIPWLMFYPPYDNISIEAKILYGLLLDRMSLSYRDPAKWSDNDGAYIYYQREEVMQLLKITNKTATKLFKELETVGLINRKKQGFGKPTKIYINDFSEGSAEAMESMEHAETGIPNENDEKTATRKQSGSNSEPEKGKNSPSEKGKNSPSEKGKNSPSLQGKIPPLPNNIYPSYDTSVNQSGEGTATNHTESASKAGRTSHEEAEKQVARQIDWNALYNEYPQKRAYLETIAAIMADELSSNAARATIGGATRTRAEIRARLADVTTKDVAAILDKLKGHVNNLRGYLLTCLYNAPASRAPGEDENEYDAEITKYVQALKRKREQKKAQEAG